MFGQALIQPAFSEGKCDLRSCRNAFPRGDVHSIIVVREPVKTVFLLWLAVWYLKRILGIVFLESSVRVPESFVRVFLCRSAANLERGHGISFSSSVLHQN